MSEDVHERAEHLISVARVEGISAPDREWLDAHLERCERCADRADALQRVVASLRSVSIPPDPAVVEATQQRVHVRALELREEQVRLRALWVACAFSWGLGVLSAPLVWWGLQWVGEHLALPSAVWVTAFILWWTVPVAGAGAVLAWLRGGSSNGGYLRGLPR